MEIMEKVNLDQIERIDLFLLYFILFPIGSSYFFKNSKKLFG
jgi:hypothetical protein